MSELITVKHDSNALATIDAIAQECSLVGGSGGISEAFKMAAGMQKLRGLITGEMMKDIMSLMGTRLGFKTDKDSGKSGPPYAVDVVKDVMIEGMLRGARAINNEINIIASGCYLTREFFTRKLREHPGLTNLRMTFGAPVRVPNTGDPSTGRAYISAVAAWELNGVHDSLDKSSRPIEGSTKEVDERFVLTYDQWTKDDALLGKADRKLKAAIYARITGSVFMEGDASESPVPKALPPAALSELTERLAGTKPEPPPAFSADDLRAALKLCEDLASVTAVEKTFFTLAQTDSDHSTLAGECEAVREAIRANRGGKK